MLRRLNIWYDNIKEPWRFLLLIVISSPIFIPTSWDKHIPFPIRIILALDLLVLASLILYRMFKILKKNERRFNTKK